MIYDDRRGEKLNVCVHYSKIRDEETDIRKKMGSLPLFFFMFFFSELSISGTKKIDDDERQGNMRQHRLRIEVNDKRWI